MKNEKNIVPPQTTGNHSGAKAEKIMHTEDKAVQLFIIAKQRLLDINNWHNYSKVAGGSFMLTDAGGNAKELPETGNYIRIDLPGPGPQAGSGYDWVRIEEITETADADTDYFAFRVRPVKAPTSTDAASAHFYTSQATSSFIIQREGKKVIAAEEGRNEIPNTNAQSAIDKVRNTLVAAGATLGIAALQWKGLMEGLLDE